MAQEMEAVGGKQQEKYEEHQRKKEMHKKAKKVMVMG